MSRIGDHADKVEFRWRQQEEEYRVRLANHAAKAQRSPADHARELLKEALRAEDTLPNELRLLRQEVDAMRDELIAMRRVADIVTRLEEGVYGLQDDIANLAVKLLVDAGQLSLEDAREWASKTFDAE
jgi:hypothetical protein